MDTAKIVVPILVRFKGKCDRLPALSVPPRKVRLIAFIKYGIRMSHGRDGIKK